MLPVLLSLVAACATPQQRCLNSAANALHRLQSDISRTQGNIDRGYAIHRQQQSYPVTATCYDKDDKPYLCEDIEYRTVETPVTIDIAQERRKLAEMRRKLPAVKRAMLAKSAECKRLYPK
ncbi:MAG: hypothetical protein CSA68_00350 [Rhodobacterales bacterium]|nr:MAG: hypothetical protein CSA68_00350 [Rhodobacterales bacterium]